MYTISKVCTVPYVPSACAHTHSWSTGTGVSVPSLTELTVFVQVRGHQWAPPPSLPPTLTQLTLQEALRVFRPQFIAESERRQRKVREAGGNRLGGVATRRSPIGGKEETNTQQERRQKLVCLGEFGVLPYLLGQETTDGHVDCRVCITSHTEYK